MFTEILRIRPVLDPAGGKAMEASLSARFAKVAKGFGGGLKAVIKGSLLGISLGLLNKILNPLEAVEERIKNLLNQGTDLADMAERFGTSPGQLKRLQDVAQSLGVAPDQLKDTLTKYAEAVETARKELKNPFEKPSESTQVLTETVGKGGVQQKDIAESFLTFLRFLNQEKNTPTRTVTREGASPLTRTGQESRQFIEEQVLGNAQFGGMKRLIDTNFEQQAVRLNEPSAQQINRAVKQTGDAAKIQRETEVQNQTASFLRDAGTLNAQMIRAMEAAQAREEKTLGGQLASYEDLRKGADAVQDIKEGFTNLLNNVSEALGLLRSITSFIPKVTNNRWWNGLMGGKGVNQ